MNRDAKDAAKIKSQNNPNFCSACFDLQQVLIIPYSLSSQLYYRSKLATYNLTIFDMELKVANCYMWYEGVGQRGANNIFSCIYKFIFEHYQNETKEFAFFSDNCMGQNKNKTIVAMYLNALWKLDISIFHYYMEKGHTQNESDSVHANIEKASKNVNIYSPQQWFTVVRTAKRSNLPYKVIEMEAHMLDFDQLANHYCASIAKDLRCEKLEWNKVHVLYFSCDHHDSFFKRRFDEENFREVPV